MKRIKNILAAALFIALSATSCQDRFEYFSNDAYVLKVTPKQALISATVSFPDGAGNGSEVGITYADDSDFANS